MNSSQLIKLREKTGLSQPEIANAIGTTTDIIKDWEESDRNKIPFTTAKLLIEKSGMTTILNVKNHLNFQKINFYFTFVTIFGRGGRGNLSSRT